MMTNAVTGVDYTLPFMYWHYSGFYGECNR